MEQTLADFDFRRLGKNIGKDQFTYLSEMDQKKLDDYILFLLNRSPVCHGYKMNIMYVARTVPYIYMCVHCYNVMGLPDRK